MNSPQRFSYTDFQEGATCERNYVITRAVYEGFLETFCDCNPLHIDSACAEASGFAGPVMHGAILGGFLSHFVGMVFPGALSLLLSMELRFLKPSYLGDTLRLHAKVCQKLDTQQVLVLHVTFYNDQRGHKAATGQVQVKLRAG